MTGIACSSNHSGFVVDGVLHTEGSNKYGQLGHTQDGGDVHAPVLLEAADGHRPAVLQVALSPNYSAVLTEGGAVWTWGYGGGFWAGAGGLGHGSNASLASPKLVERFVENGLEVAQVSCGEQHTLVLTTDGDLWSTGKGEFGRLGRGRFTDEQEFEEIHYFAQSNDSVLNPLDVTSIIKVDSGVNFSAAMSAQGEIWCWGRNDYGQVGLGERAKTDMYSAAMYPVLMRTLPLEGHQVVDFACGKHHTVALTSAGAIYEWGNRLSFEPAPVTLPSRYAGGLKNVERVCAGDGVSFALTTEGGLYVWGPKARECFALDSLDEENFMDPVLVPPETFGHQQVLEIAAAEGRFLAVTLES